MNENIKRILKHFLLFAILIAIFVAMMVASFALPNKPIRDNIEESLPELELEKTYFRPFFTDNTPMGIGVTLDNYTDSIILNVAVDKNENFGDKLLKRAVSNNYIQYDEGNQIENLKINVSDNNATTNVAYTRYWFGIEAFLRPLLLLLNIQQIRYINIIFITLLLFLAFYMITKKLNAKYAFAFAISMLLMNFFVIPVSLQYLPVMAITLIMVIVLTVVSNREDEDKLLTYIFLTCGCITAFMDLLTYPLITLGIPLIVEVLLKIKKQKFSIKYFIIMLIKLCLIWGVAYGLTYVSKWIIASLILQQNEVTSAFNQFLFRADVTGEKVNKIDVIIKNFNIYFNKAALLIIIIYLIIWITIIIKNKKNNFKIINIIPLCITMILPYLWYIVLSNHSNIHYWMTYRIQSITMFSFLSMTLLLSSKNKE